MITSRRGRGKLLCVIYNLQYLFLVQYATNISTLNNISTQFPTFLGLPGLLLVGGGVVGGGVKTTEDS